MILPRIERTVKMLCKHIVYGNQKGFVLPVGLMFLGILAVLGVTAVVMTTTDLKIGDNYKTSVMAFYDAEAGVNFAIQSIENGLEDGTFSLPENVGDTVSLSTFTVPDDFSFVLGDITKTGDNAYSFSSTGNSGHNAQARIRTQCQKGLAINYAAFGDLLVDMKAFSLVYSYDSSVTASPTPGGSTGEADVGSNGTVSVKNDTTVDGDVALGDDGVGNEAVYTFTGTPIISGEEGADVDRVEPDPLGIVGGEYASKITYYSTNNDNAAAGVGTSLSLGNGDSITLSAGNYYFTDIELKNGASVNIDATGGQVNIWLTGALEAKNGSSFNVNGLPTDFTIFSNATDNVIFKHGSHFSGLVYAPYATVEMKNSGNLYGAVWAQTVDMKNSAVVYYDTSLRDEYTSNQVVSTGWIEEMG